MFSLFFISELLKFQQHLHPQPPDRHLPPLYLHRCPHHLQDCSVPTPRTPHPSSVSGLPTATSSCLPAADWSVCRSASGGVMTSLPVWLSRELTGVFSIVKWWHYRQIFAVKFFLVLRPIKICARIVYIYVMVVASRVSGIKLCNTRDAWIMGQKGGAGVRGKAQG